MEELLVLQLEVARHVARVRLRAVTAKERLGKVISLVWGEVEGQPGKREEFRRERE